MSEKETDKIITCTCGFRPGELLHQAIWMMACILKHYSKQLTSFLQLNEKSEDAEISFEVINLFMNKSVRSSRHSKSEQKEISGTVRSEKGISKFKSLSPDWFQ